MAAQTISDNNGCQQTATDSVKNITGIYNVNGGVIFEIYPNPAKTEVVVELQNAGNGAEVWLKDVLGRALYIRPVNASTTRIDLSAYAAGIYFVEITDGYSRSTKKLVIEK
jgi:hypothetical protein